MITWPEGNMSPLRVLLSVAHVCWSLYLSLTVWWCCLSVSHIIVIRLVTDLSFTLEISVESVCSHLDHCHWKRWRTATDLRTATKRVPANAACFGAAYPWTGKDRFHILMSFFRELRQRNKIFHCIIDLLTMSLRKWRIQHYMYWNCWLTSTNEPPARIVE